MKLGIMTDLHLGVRPYGLIERENDFYEQYYKAIDAFVEAKVDIVIIAGDIFDQPRPSPRALEVFSNGLKDLISNLASNNIKIINIIGNHAIVQSTGFTTADEFLTIIPGFQGNYFLLDEDTYISEKDVFIAGLRYHFNYELDSLVNKIDNLNQMASESDSSMKILVLHQSFKEFCGFLGEEFSIEDIDVSNFDLVICGHIHERLVTEFGNGTVFLQPGSIERLTVAEARDEEVNGKGVFILDTGNKTAMEIANGFYQLKSKRRFIIADMYMNKEEDLDSIKNEIFEYIKDCDVAPILFLTVHDVTHSYNALMDFTNDIRSDCLTVRFNYIDEDPQQTSDFVVNSGDIPEPRDILKLALNPLDKDEARLGLDLYDLLKDGKDASELLSDFLQKRRDNKEKEFNKNYDDEELREIIKYFENL